MTIKELAVLVQAEVDKGHGEQRLNIASMKSMRFWPTVVITRVPVIKPATENRERTETEEVVFLLVGPTGEF